MENIIFQLGMAQMLVEGGAVEQNLARAMQMIKQAAEHNCKVVVLPECLDIGWTDPAARDLAQPIPGPHSDRLCQAAQQAQIYVAAGLTERAGDKIYNAAILISPAGEILLKHRKINIMDIAQDLYATGDGLGVVQTSLGTIGLNICADNFPARWLWAIRWPAWAPKFCCRLRPGPCPLTMITIKNPTVSFGRVRTPP